MEWVDWGFVNWLVRAVLSFAIAMWIIGFFLVVPWFILLAIIDNWERIKNKCLSVLKKIHTSNQKTKISK